MNLRLLSAIFAAVLLLSPLPAAAEDASEPPPERAAKEQLKCRKAAVNPVTGHAVCVEPRGAEVDPPPPEAFVRPCPPREHDDVPGTVYERYSGC